MAIENEKTIVLLQSLGAPDNCPQHHIDPNPTGMEYWNGFSVTDKLICNGQETTGGNFHPTCKPCKIRGKEFPEYDHKKYMIYCFGENWNRGSEVP